MGFAGTEVVGLTRPAQFGLALTAQAEFIICNQSIDEVFLTIQGQRHYLWRAVDQDGNVLDILVQSRRDKKAAKKFFRKLLKGCQYVPRVIITDKLKSYEAAKRELLPGVKHRQHRYLNNRVENSHQPTRQRERRLQGFKSPGHAQRFRSAYGPIAQHFRPRRHRLPAFEYRQRWGKGSTPGRTSRAFPPPHKTDDRGSRAPSCSLILSTGNKLTTPGVVLEVGTADTREAVFLAVDMKAV
jgi:hypothetical protein